MVELNWERPRQNLHSQTLSINGRLWKWYAYLRLPTDGSTCIMSDQLNVWPSEQTNELRNDPNLLPDAKDSSKNKANLQMRCKLAYYLRVSGIFSNSLVPIVYFKQASSLKVFKKEGENYKNVHAELGSL